MANIDLINWTVSEAQILTGEGLEPGNTNDSVPSLDAFLAMIESECATGDAQPSTQTGRATTLENEIGGAPQADDAFPHERAITIDVTGTTEIAAPASAPVVTLMMHAEEQSIRVVGSPTSIILVTGIQVGEARQDAPAEPEPALSHVPPVTPVAWPISPETQNETAEPALLVAIKQTDYRAARADLERAITLRWTLRDILGERLKFSPASHDDLQTLIEFGLVEMRGDLPTLTQAGLGVIA